MVARLLIVFALMSCSGVAFGASSNPSVEERLATLETTMKLQFEALGKQIETMNAATNERIDATNERIDALDKRIDALDKRIDETNERIDATNKRIDTLSKQIDATNERIDATNERIDTLSKQIDANHQSTLKLIEAINDATNKRIDTLNSWWIVLLGGIVGWIVFIATQAIHNREKTETTKTSAHGAEIAHKA